MEVDVVPPPMSVAAAGILRVELRLGSGQCQTKGCVEGEQQNRLKTMLDTAKAFDGLKRVSSFQKMQRTAPSTTKQTTQSPKS